MSIWQKTLFYLGLVDEDDPNAVMGRRDDTGMGSDVRPLAPEAEERRAVRTTGQHRVPAGGADGGGGRRVEPPLTARRRVPTGGVPELSDAGVVVRPADRPLVRNVSDTDLESEVITARSYSDAQLLADHIRANIPVVLDLRKVEPAMVRRLVDFASGLTYALGGTMRKVGQGVILVTPANVNISRDERRRLQELGYYQAPDES
jgi:FtsZ-interacting cell division protein YlmF